MNRSTWVLAAAAALAREWLYDFADPDARGAVSKGLGALFVASLVFLLMREVPPNDRPEKLFVAWILIEQAITVAGSFAYAVHPWPAAPGQSIVSALLGFDLGRITIAPVAVAIAWFMWRNRRNL